MARGKLWGWLRRRQRLLVISGVYAFQRLVGCNWWNETGGKRQVGEQQADEREVIGRAATGELRWGVGGGG